MPVAWMRELTIILTSKLLNKRMTFGDNWKRGEDDLSISVTGTKYLSALKDTATVKIINLTPVEISQLIIGQYYDIEIKCGYRTGGLHTIFKGGVVYMSNVLGDRKSNDLYIFCASNIVAKYGQRRMNLSINSGMNMYNMLRFICERAGIRNSNVSDEFKNRIVRETLQTSNTIGSIVERIAASGNYAVQSDASYGAELTMFNPYRTDKRFIKVDPSTIILTAGYPTLDTNGLRMSLMPTFDFMPGDTIQIDNSIIDIGTTSQDWKEMNRGYFLDKDGKYIIYQIDFSLENRGADFSLNMLCKAKSLFSEAGLNVFGGANANG